MSNVQISHNDPQFRLLERVLGSRRAGEVLTAVESPALGAADGGYDRAQLASALSLVLFEDILGLVPHARAYVQDAVRAGRRICFDHGALRTVATDCGALPGGVAAFARFLEPLGYRSEERYDLRRLGMTGYAFRHADLPEQIPQYFISELHPEPFSAPFREAVARVVGDSRDPLTRHACDSLAALQRGERLSLPDGAQLVLDLAACFALQHDVPSIDDYDILRRESPEMAWIATEGNAFNHATDRVADVEGVAELQRRLGRPVKPTVEVSKSGRVRQTAFRAATVERLFLDEQGRTVVRRVPGSFHEFISRDTLEDGSLDLAFDAGNATAIFGMTGPDAA